MAGDSNLSIGVYVMNDVTDQKTYLGADLDSNGITPIWVRIANISTDRSFLIDVSEITLATPSNQAAFSGGSASADDSAGQALMITDIFVGSLLMSFIGAAMLTSASYVKKNLVERGLYSHTLAPGQETSGFIYVRRSKSLPDLTGGVLTIAARSIPSAAGAVPDRYGVTL
jgi:hypothetical protein